MKRIWLYIIPLSIIFASCQSKEMTMEQESSSDSESMDQMMEEVVEELPTTELEEESTTFTYRGNIWDYPASSEELIINELGAKRINFKEGVIEIKHANANFLLKSFIKMAVINPGIKDLDFITSDRRPKVTYWEYVVSQLPDWIPFPDHYGGYVEEQSDWNLMLGALVYSMDRDAAFLRSTFDHFKEAIYENISPEEFQGNGFDITIDRLLIAHDDIQQKASGDVLESIYSQMLHDPTHDIWDRQDNRYAFLSPITQGSPISETYDLDWFYSFWVRRHHEQNTEVVFQILMEIKRHYEFYLGVTGDYGRVEYEVRDHGWVSDDYFIMLEGEEVESPEAPVHSSESEILVLEFVEFGFGDYPHFSFKVPGGDRYYDFGESENELGEWSVLEDEEGMSEYQGKLFDVTIADVWSSFNCCDGMMDIHFTFVPSIVDIQLHEE